MNRTLLLPFLIMLGVLPSKAFAQEFYASNVRNQSNIPLAQYFSDSNFCVIGNSVAIQIDTSQYTQEEGHGFFVSYPYPNEEQFIRVQVPIKDDKLMLSTAIYTKGNANYQADKAGKMTLFYYAESPRSPVEIASFHIVFVNETLLKEELSTLKKYLIAEGVPQNELKQDFLEHIQVAYGATDMVAFNRWVKAKKLLQ